MAEIRGHEGRGDQTAPASQPSGDERGLSTRARAKFEHEAAALDLSEAEQLAAWSANMAEQGDATESQRLAEISARLYESANRRRQIAERLENESGDGTRAGSRRPT